LIAALFWIIGCILLILIILMVLPLYFKMNGRYLDTVETNEMDGTLQFGSRTFGFQFNIQNRHHVEVGPYSKPWFSFRTRAQKQPMRGRSDSRSISKHAVPRAHWFRWLQKSIHFHTFDLTGRLGFENPMTTGLVFGILSAVRNSLQLPSVRFAVTPKFQATPNTDLKGCLAFHFRPVIVLWHGLLALIKLRQ